MVIDLEDAVGDLELEGAEQKLCAHLHQIKCALDDHIITYADLPLIFVRVRTPGQMARITNRLGDLQKVLTGYVFPKFNYENGKEFLHILKSCNSPEMVLYGMPILESAEIIYKESRIDTLLRVKELLDSYQEYILNVRIGATDFCGLFGIRRKADSTIYDVSIIRDCISDIINIFTRKENGYVVSGPVWEFFSKDPRILKPQLRMTPFHERYGSTGLEKRSEMINQYIDGLINEVLLDKLNGLNGKTIIHPTHIPIVHALYVVTHEEYMDAASIVEHSGQKLGVMKSAYENKMNEMKPHLHWATQILLRAKAFGVCNPDQNFTSIIMEQQNQTELLEVK